MTEMISRKARKISAFWEGGSGGAEREKILTVKRNNAREKRIGRIVNV